MYVVEEAIINQIYFSLGAVSEIFPCLKTRAVGNQAFGYTSRLPIPSSWKSSKELFPRPDSKMSTFTCSPLQVAI